MPLAGSDLVITKVEPGGNVFVDQMLHTVSRHQI